MASPSLLPSAAAAVFLRGFSTFFYPFFPSLLSSLRFHNGAFEGIAIPARAIRLKRECQDGMFRTVFCGQQTKSLMSSHGTYSFLKSLEFSLFPSYGLFRLLGCSQMPSWVLQKNDCFFPNGAALPPDAATCQPKKALYYRITACRNPCTEILNFQLSSGLIWLRALTSCWKPDPWTQMNGKIQVSLNSFDADVNESNPEGEIASKSEETSLWTSGSVGPIHYGKSYTASQSQ